jgi:hypothetical protein
MRLYCYLKRNRAPNCPPITRDSTRCCIRVADLLAFLLTCLAGAPERLLSQALTVDIFAPSAYQHIEAPYNEYIPFSLPSSRYQQVFSASQFGAISNGGWITEILFRVDTPNGYGFREVLPNLQINLSTTSRGPDELSATFSDNIGADDMVVFGPGSASIESFVHIGSPQLFLIDFPLSNRLYYEPAKGNLLMDVRLYQGASFGAVPSFDAVDNVGDSISRAYGDITATSGFRDSSGLVTMFLAIPIPEPSTLALLLSGTVYLGWWYRRKRTN